MKTDPDGFVTIYLDWLKEYSTGRDMGAGWSELTLPYIDCRNDFLQIYIREDSDGLTITDEGQTIRDLSRVGCDLKSKTKRRHLAEIILRSKGLDPSLLDQGEICTKAYHEEFAPKLHATCMSMLAIGGLANTSPPHVASMFKDDVAEFLKSSKIPFEAGVKFKGKSENEHEFDFFIPKSGSRPDRIVQTFNRPETVHIESYAWRVIDTKVAIEDSRTEFFAVFSEASTVSRKNDRVLLSQGVRTYGWRDKEQLAKRLAVA